MTSLLAASWAFAAPSDEPTADAILKGEAPPIDYSRAVKCLPSYKIERTEPLSEQYILFHLRDGTLWLAQMRGRCPGIGPNSHLAFNKDQNRLCEWDSVRVVYDNGIGADVNLGPQCNLPKFDPVSAEQVEMLKQQLRKPTHPPGENKQ